MLTMNDLVGNNALQHGLIHQISDIVSFPLKNLIKLIVLQM